MNDVFKKRTKSFIWRLGGMIFAMLLQFLSENLSILPISNQLTIVLGLIIGELTKQLNSKKST